MSNNNQKWKQGHNKNNNGHNKNNNHRDKNENYDASRPIEEKIKENPGLITTTQLRLLLSHAVLIKNKIDMEKIKRTESYDKLSNDMLNEIKYLLIRHIYQCGRDSKVKDFDKEFQIQDKIRNIIDSDKTVKSYYDFYRYLEEIVAYLKYYEKKDDKNK